jgi:hypothetical protein
MALWVRNVSEKVHNLLDFAMGFVDNIDILNYHLITDHIQFGFDPLDVDDNLAVRGVVGMGIKSVILYHLYPSVFPRRSSRDLYGMYFLTEHDSFDLPSGTSEFIMIDDTISLDHNENRNYKLDQNYWYPYGVFTLHAMSIYRLLKNRLAQGSILLNDEHMFVWVSLFLEFVCSQNTEYIETMLGGGQD